MDLDVAQHHHPAPAPYGRACISCARAKSKCMTSNLSGGKCERCHRLGKECLPAPTVRKSRVVKSTPATKTARLEEKLDGLVSLLQSASRAQPVGLSCDVATAPMQQSVVVDSLRPPSLAPHGQSMLHPVEDFDSHIHEPKMFPSEVGPRSISATLIPRGCEPLVGEAEDYLKTFKMVMVKRFPFIRLPELMTAQELREERPFLWLSVMAASSKSLIQQFALGKQLRTILGSQLLVEGERSLDLLLGALVYISWGPSHHQKPIISSLMQLAVGLLVDLSLHKSPPKESPHIMLNYDVRGCPRPCSFPSRTMEERRTAIGCYSINANISSFFQKLDPPRWTAYLEESLQMLTDNEECGSDRLLVCLVRLQLIEDRITQAPWHDRSPESLTSRAPVIFYLRALESQLQDFKNSIPTDIQQDETLLLHLYSTTLSLHEFALSRHALSAPNINSNNNNNSSSNNSLPDTALRLDSLHASLRATQSWFTLFLSIPPAQYIGFSTAIFTQMAHCIVALYRLSTYSDACTDLGSTSTSTSTSMGSTYWDTQLVRETLDFSGTLGALAARMGRVRTEAAFLADGRTEENDFWGATERRLGSIKRWWDGRVLLEERTRRAVAGGGSGVGGSGSGSGAGTGTGMGVGGFEQPRNGGEEEEMMMMMSTAAAAGQFWDEGWLDILGLRDYQF